MQVGFEGAATIIILIFLILNFFKYENLNSIFLI